MRITPQQYKEQVKVKPKQSESANQITKNAVLWLNLHGFKAWRQNNGAQYDPKQQCFRKNPNHQLGLPDICGYQKGTGRALYVEVKAGKDTLSPEQIQFLSDAEKAGALTGVIKASAEIEPLILNQIK